MHTPPLSLPPFLVIVFTVHYTLGSRKGLRTLLSEKATARDLSVFLSSWPIIRSFQASMTRQLDQLDPAHHLLLNQEEDQHQQEVDAHRRPEPESQKGKSDEGVPVAQRRGFDQRHPRLALARRDAGVGFVEAPRAVKRAQALLLLSPALLAPGLQGAGLLGQTGHRVAAHVEVDLEWEGASQQVALRLRGAVRVGYGDVVQRVQIVPCGAGTTSKIKFLYVQRR